MKQSIARQQSRHRNHTPSVIYLPPPKPVAAKRPVAVVPETPIALPETSEIPKIEPGEVQASPTPALSRQARRNALRAEAKALRRQGRPAMAARQPARRMIETIAEPAAVAAPVTIDPAPPPAAAQPPAYRPLPRARSVAIVKPRGLALVVQRLRALFVVKRAKSAPASGAIADQLRTVRAELAALQQSIDRMIDGVAG